MKKILTTKSLRILLNRLGNFLPRENIKIFYAPTEKDIPEIQRSENADLIIMELITTGDDIEKVCSEIRNDKAQQNIPILLLCEKSTSAITKCHICKATTYITSPVNVEELLHKIFKILFPLKRELLRVQVQVLVKGESKEMHFFANSKDINTSGMLIETDKFLKTGETVKCSFFLESNQIETIGQIKRGVEKEPGLYDYGLIFINLNTKSKKIIEGFMEKSTKNLKSMKLPSSSNEQ